MLGNISKLDVLTISCLLALAGGVAAADSRYDREVVETFDFDVSPGGTLAVDVPDADIAIEVGSGGRVEIEMEISARDLADARKRYDDMNFRASVDGGAVTLRGDGSRGVWSWGNRGHFRVVARIHVPERFDLNLRTQDGDIAIEAIDGRVELKTGDGDVAIGRARTSGLGKVATSDGDISIGEWTGDEVTVSTSDGDIAVGRIDTGELTLRSSDGDISVGTASGRVSAETSDGDISIGIDRLGDTSLKSGDGDIEIRLDGSMGADIDLRGDEVSFRRSEVSFEGEMTERKVEGRLNGGGPRLSASSRDGGITLRVR